MGSGPTTRSFSRPRIKHRHGEATERIRVYEKLQTNIWVFNGTFDLVDGWQERDGARNVFKFRLQLVETDAPATLVDPIIHTRVIPTQVKFEVWKRDGGKCVRCGATDNLHFDHDLPFSKGGTSLLAANIQIMCARHNLAKRDRIE